MKNSKNNKETFDLKPVPRKAHKINCIIISLYGTVFFTLFWPWYNDSFPALSMKIILLLTIFFSLYFLLAKRQSIFNFFCRLSRRKILLFEFSFFFIICFIYGIQIILMPVFTHILIMDTSITKLLSDDILKRYIVFSFGATLCVGGISGFDVYPSNMFYSLNSLIRLIDITKGLLKASVQALITVTGAIIVGNIFKYTPFSTKEIYEAGYGILGCAWGISAVLGSRLSELLYKLNYLESIDRRQNINPQNVERKFLEEEENIEEIL